jgi:hypothetical protein
MMHATFETTRWSFAVKSKVREHVLQTGPDDSRTFSPINSSRPPHYQPKIFLPAGSYSRVINLWHARSAQYFASVMVNLL